MYSGAGGRGDVYKRKEVGAEELVGHVDMLQASAGWTLGGQVYQEIIFFQTETDFDNFTSGNFEFGADANVVALTASASAKATTMGNQGPQAGLTADTQASLTQGAAPTIPQYTKGMAVFTISLGGLMYQATVSGQKFNYTAKK